MPIRFMLSLLLLFGATGVFAQKEKQEEPRKEGDGYQYDIVTENYFKAFNNAKFIVNYYFSSTYPDSSTFSYEIIIIDSMLMMAFNSPESEQYNYLSFQKKRLLDEEQLKALKKDIKKAKLTQAKDGIPRPKGYDHVKEALILKSDDQKMITGGIVHALSYDEKDPAKVKKLIEQERKNSSSLGGNYDVLFDSLRRLFPELEGLKTEAAKTR